MLSRVKQYFKIKVSLIPIKAAIFFFYGACELFSPYMALQGLEVGITMQHMTLIFALLPIATMAGPTVMGYLCDRFGHLRLILSLCIVACALFHTLLLYVDVICAFAEQQPTIVSFRCNDTTIVWLWNQSIDLGRGDSFNMAVPVADCGPSSAYRTLNMTFELVDSDWLRATETHEKQNKSICHQFVECPEETSTFLQTIDLGGFFKNGNDFPLGLWCYIIFLFIGRLSQNATLSMLESCSVYLALHNGGTIGSQQVLGVIGKSIFTFVGSTLVTFTKDNKGGRSYELLFYGADIMFLMTIVSVVHLDIEMQVQKDIKLWRNVREIIRLPDITVFLLMMAITSVCYNYIDSFFYVYLTELGASDLLMSLTNATMNFVSIPLLLMGDCAVLKLGYGPVISLSLLIFGVRMAVYSLIRNPWLCLPLEVLKAFTTQFVAVAVGIFCSSAAPAALFLTVCGLNHANLALGRALGSFLSGFLTDYLGRQHGFQLMSAAAVIAAVLYYLAYHFYLKDVEMRRRQNATVQRTLPQ